MNSRLSVPAVLSIFAVLAVQLCSAQQQTAEDEAFFETRVRPLLADRCFECHRRKAEGGLRLDSLNGMIKGGKSGPAVVARDATNSLLWQVMAGKHADISMPPNERLSESEVDVFRQWIASGAHWPDQSHALNGRDPIIRESDITDEERNFWSFQPISRPTVPSLDDKTTNGASAESKRATHPVDALIVDQQKASGLTPHRPATPRSLIRRLTYDLTGLPPNPQDVIDFEADMAVAPSEARAKLVERLLASKRYGERWAQHWLDLVRYADTAGDAADYPIPEAYKYRNYVIDTFNQDKPYDQFVREQIAGDLMTSRSPEEAWERTIATGYIAISRRIGVTPETLPHITIEDTIDNLSKTFLGLSVGCARCHDHKFDPIPTSDYYALYGIFKSTLYPHAGAEHKPYRSDFVYRVGKEAADQLLREHRSALAPLLKKERAAFERYRDFQRKPVDRPGYNRDVAWKEVMMLRSEIEKAAETFPDLDIAFAVSEGKPEDAHIQKQGEPRNKAEMVRRGFLQILGGQILAEELSHQSGRLQLAHWIANDQNPLTARVIVNRIWHHHFGRGLVATTSDFGVRGTRPSHPQLLDFLANYLIDNHWSIKQLHRLIVSSETYGLDSGDVPRNSAIDPENIGIWRSNRRRLDAEQIRDSILQFSGSLDESRSGRHPFPNPLTYFYRQHEPFIGNFETSQRTIYQFRQRIRKNVYLDTFDAPDGNLHVGERRSTTTGIQSLFMLNSPFVAEQSHTIASRLRKIFPSSDLRIEWLYANLFNRVPTKEEVQVVRSQLTAIMKQTYDFSQLEDGEEADLDAWASLIRAMLCSNAFLFVD
ncbi:MAG: PSD1 and planctomycete cytochrome C domain-containing protein [Pirellula sp.]